MKHGIEMSAPVPIITSAGDLLARYPVIFCDVWGVLHDGVREYAAAGRTLERYRAQGGRVILLSNAPTPSASVARVLDEKRVRRSAWDAIVSSGDVTRSHLEAKGYAQLYHIGPDRSLPLFESLQATLTKLDVAEAIVCTGLVSDDIETGESYRPLLEGALRRQLPFVCANPDLVVDVGGRRLPCAGAVGIVYQAMGGDVYWAGKPHKPAYDLAFGNAAGMLGRAISPSEVLAIGDAIATDLAGAASAGVDALFIASGIHHDKIMRDTIVDAEQLAGLFRTTGAQAVAAMAHLA
jgi:HAD superfamily hydrolase (TIGR01459 family)